MANQVITVNRKKYAVGLFWQPTGAGFVARTYARSLARGIDKKLNLYTEYRAMVGLGARKYGHRNGMPSAAAEIMDTLTEYNSFLGVFTVGNLFYLIAVRNGVILEDKIFDNADDARAQYYKLSEIPDWGALFAPGEWGMPRAIERTLADLITGNARAILHPISRVRGGILSLCLLWGFVVGALYLFHEPIAMMISGRPSVSGINPELAAEYRRQLEEKNKELDAQFQIEKKPEIPPLVMPYDYLPDVVARAQVCFQAFGFLMQPILGWNQTLAECGETHAMVQMRRGFGTLGDFYNIATDLMPGAFVSEQDENTLTVRVALPQVKTIASLDERDAETVLRAVQTAFQSLDTPVDAEIVMDTLTNGVETANLNIVEIAAQSKLTPMQFMHIFDEFGGVYMTRCTWDAATRTWNYEVIIYAK